MRCKSVNSRNMNFLMYFFCYKMNSFIKSNVIINKMIMMVYKAFIKSKYNCSDRTMTIKEPISKANI